MYKFYTIEFVRKEKIHTAKLTNYCTRIFKKSITDK